MAEAKGSKLEKMCKELAGADRVRSHYEEQDSANAKAESLSALQKSISGQEIDYSRMPVAEQANDAKALQEIVQKRTLAYIKPNLSKIINETDPYQLAFATARSIQEHGSKTYGDLAGLLAMYKAFYDFEKSENPEQKEAIRNGFLIPSLIADRIKGKVPKDELAVITSIVASASKYDPHYQQKVLKEGIEKIRNDIAKQPKKNFTGYIKERFESDKDYLEFASALGQYQPPKEEDKKKK